MKQGQVHERRVGEELGGTTNRGLKPGNDGKADNGRTPSLDSLPKPVYHPLCSYKRIHYKELIKSERFSLSYIKGKIVQQPFGLVNTFWEIEDEFQNRLKIVPKIDGLPDALMYINMFMVGTIIYLVEPFVLDVINGVYSFKFGDVSDIVFDHLLTSPQAVSFGEFERPAFECFRLKNYKLSAQLYLRAIEKCNNDRNNAGIMYSNVASCYYNIGRFHSAIEFFKKAIGLGYIELNVLSILINSYLELGMLDEANSFLASYNQKSNQFDISDMNYVFSNYRKNCKGEFDWLELLYSTFKNTPLQFNEYSSSSLELRQSGVNPLGVYAAKDIAQGELLVVSKSFSLFGIHEVNKYFSIGSKAFQSKKGWGCDSRLLSEFMLAQKVEEICKTDGYLRREFLEFSSKDNYNIHPSERVKISQQKTEITAEEIKSRIKRSMFSINSIGEGIDDEDAFIGAGLWKFPSYFNHSCDPNVTWFTLENMMVMRARNPISQGEQLFIDYADQISFWSPQDEWLMQQSIDCSCVRHQYERKVNNSKPLYIKLDRKSLQSTGKKPLRKILKKLVVEMKNMNRWYRFAVFRDIVYLAKRIKAWEDLFQMTLSFYTELINDSFPDMKHLIFLYISIFPSILDNFTNEKFSECLILFKRMFLALFENDIEAFILFENTIRETLRIRKINDQLKIFI
jgi:tetratricopeptide (TPR) repeat protein